MFSSPSRRTSSSKNTNCKARTPSSQSIWEEASLLHQLITTSRIASKTSSPHPGYSSLLNRSPHRLEGTLRTLPTSRPTKANSKWSFQWRTNPIMLKGRMWTRVASSRSSSKFWPPIKPLQIIRSMAKTLPKMCTTKTTLFFRTKESSLLDKRIDLHQGSYKISSLQIKPCKSTHLSNLISQIDLVQAPLAKPSSMAMTPELAWMPVLTIWVWIPSKWWTIAETSLMMISAAHRNIP